MQILLSCAKTMGHTPVEVPQITRPRFVAEAEQAVRELQTWTVEDLGRALKINPQQAAENALRMAHFFADDTPEVPALLAYTGIVFQQIDAEQFSHSDLDYAQQHLFITSFLYGLLRPLDGIRPYRMEGPVRIPMGDGPTRFDYWKGLLTDFLIDAVKADDGVLLNDASAEMKRLFDWKRVQREVQVLTPDFKTIEGDREKSVVVYTKMCRGLLARHVLKNRISSVDELLTFEPDLERAAVVVHWT